MDPYEVGEMLKGALGTYGPDGPVLGPMIVWDINNHEFVLCVVDSDGVPEGLCAHPDWAEFLKLVAERSDTVQGDD